MVLLQQILFVLVAATAIGLFAKKAGQIRRNILLGHDEDFSDNSAARWKNMLLLAFGQKKMFRNPLVAMIHLVIYAGFVIINIEVLEIAIDGILGTQPGKATRMAKATHRKGNCLFINIVLVG